MAKIYDIILSEHTLEKEQEMSHPKLYNYGSSQTGSATD